MMKPTHLYCLLLVVAFSVVNANAQSGWYPQNPLPTGVGLSGVSCCTARLWIAFGTYGTVIRTTDGGTTWTTPTSGTTETLYAVSFGDSMTGTAVGSRGIIIHTTNGGATWTSQTSGTTLDLWSVSFADAHTGTAVGSRSIILRTNDAGATWTRQYIDSTSGLRGVSFIDSSTGTAVGERGTILHTTDGGATWTQKSSGTTNALFAVSYGNGNVGIAGGYEGVCVRTTDRGATWTRGSAPVGHLIAVSFSDSMTATALGVGGVGTIQQTSDGGISWEQRSYGTRIGVYLSAISFADAKTGAIVGTSGTILHTTDGGTTWILLSNGCTDDLGDVALIDSATATAVGSGGTILHTTDAGATWTSQSSGVTTSLTGISFTSAWRGTAVGSDGTILCTRDAGATWTRQTSGTTHFLSAVSFTDSNTGTAVGDCRTILRTTNGGTTWTSQLGVPWSGAVLWDVAFTNASTGTAVGDSGKIFHTTDGGVTWASQSTGTRLDLRGVWFNDALTGTAVGRDGTILRTTDGGTLWMSQSSGTTMFLDDVCFTDANEGTVVGSEGTILHTTNGGATWTSEPSGTTELIHAVSFRGASIGTAVGNSGTILRTKSVAPTEIAGNLRVLVSNAEDWGGPGIQGRVTLYSPGGAFVAQQTTDSAGVAVFRAIPPGTGFSYTVNQVRPENAAIPHLYWGKKTGVSIAGAATTTESFTRNAPYNLEWHLYDTTTNQSAYTTTIGRGTGLRAEVIVRNPSYSGALARTVRSSLILDRDKVAPYDLVISSSNALLGVGATRTDKMYFTLNANGSYFITSVEYADSGGQEVETDGEPWSTTPFLTVTDPAFPLPVAPPNMIASLDTPVTVMWTRPAGASSFRLQVGRDSVFTSGLILHDFPTVDTFAVLHSLSFLTSYWWHVNAYNPATGISAFLHPWEFSTGLSLPGTITLVDPSKNAVVNADTLLLRWKSTKPLVDRYWLEYGLDSVFTFKAIDSLLLDTTVVIRNMIKSLEYYWRVRAHNLSGWGPYSNTGRFLRSLTAVNTMPQGIPSDWVLMQNFPNPFNPSTTITFGLPQRAQVRVTVYNTLGEAMSELVNGDMEAGYHEVQFDGKNLSSGVYFYRMQAGSYVETKKLILTK
jgi:photosystem II stability/assembly factor-like uncharacterized protein